MDAISSTQNKRVRYVKSLQTKARLRRSERKLVLEGDRLIADALSSGGHPHLALYSLENADYQVIARLQQSKCELLPVSHEVLSFASDTKEPPGIVALFAIPKPPIPQPTTRVLILDAVREPGNLGTILRTAAAAGVDLAIIWRRVASIPTIPKSCALAWALTFASRWSRRPGRKSRASAKSLPFTHQAPNQTLNTRLSIGKATGR